MIAVETVNNASAGRIAPSSIAVGDAMSLSSSSTSSSKKLCSTATTITNFAELDIPCMPWSEVHVGRLVGKGGFCSVYSVALQQTRTDQELVIKVVQPNLKNKRHTETAINDIEAEAKILKQLGQHKHIIQVHAMCSDNGDKCIQCQHPGGFLILSRLEDTLSTRLKHWRRQRKSWPFNSKEPSARTKVEKIALGIAAGLYHIHSRGIVHRDIKPQNIGFGCDDTAIIFDFGLAKEVGISKRTSTSSAEPTMIGREYVAAINDYDENDDDDSQTSSLTSTGNDDDEKDDEEEQQHKEQKEDEGQEQEHHVEPERPEEMTGLVGTPRYMAPEVFERKLAHFASTNNENNNYSWMAVDVYSFGLLLHELITLRVPFRRLKTPQQIRECIVWRNYRPSVRFIPTRTLRSTIQQCWARNADVRPTMDQVSNSLRTAIQEFDSRHRLSSSSGEQGGSNHSKNSFFRSLDFSLHSVSSSFSGDESGTFSLTERLNFGNNRSIFRQSGGSKSSDEAELSSPAQLLGDRSMPNPTSNRRRRRLSSALLVGVTSSRRQRENSLESSGEISLLDDSLLTRSVDAFRSKNFKTPFGKGRRRKKRGNNGNNDSKATKSTEESKNKKEKEKGVVSKDG